MFGSLTTLATTLSALFLGSIAARANPGGRDAPKARGQEPHQRIDPAPPSFVIPQLPPQARQPVQKAKPPASPPEQTYEPLPLMERKIAPRVVPPAKAAQLLIKYLQDSKATGVFAASEIDDMWDMACEAMNLFKYPYGTIRIEMQSVPEVYIGRKQLGIEYCDVRIRTGLRRATLYRIPDRARAAAKPPIPAPTLPLPTVAMAGAEAGFTAGQNPASAEVPRQRQRIAA